MVNVKDGQTVGRPEAITTVDMHRTLPIGFIDDGTYVYRKAIAPYATGDIYIAELDDTFSEDNVRTGDSLSKDGRF